MAKTAACGTAADGTVADGTNADVTAVGGTFAYRMATDRTVDADMTE